MRRWRYFFSRWQNWLGFLLVLFFIVVALAAPILSPMDPVNPDIFQRVGHTRAERLDVDPHPPSDVAPLGTLPYQYDIYHALIWGSRSALVFGLVVVSCSGLFGVIFGAVAGYAGGITNTIMMRVSDAFLSFPVIAGVVFLQQLVAITVEAMGGTYIFNVGDRGPLIDIVGERTSLQILLSWINPLMLSLILFSWMPYARMVNASVLSLKNTEFVQASRALGASSARTIFRHLIPNSMAPSIVLMARDVGGVVILQATLTFIQLGGNSPWGDMLYRGRDWILNASGMLKYWWVYLPATVAVILFGIAWNLLGDGLNDILDPTAHYGAHQPSFWSRVFGKGKIKNIAVEPTSTPETVMPQNISPPVHRTMQDSPIQPIPPDNGIDPVLLAARECATCGNLDQALHAYQHLIWRGRSIDAALPDLAQLVQKHPHDPQVWQTLGDALMRAGHEAHALQSYAQARKLKE